MRILIESNLSQNLWSTVHITFPKPYPWHFSEEGTFSVHPGSSFWWGNRCGWGQWWRRPCTYRRSQRGCASPWSAFQAPLERLPRFLPPPDGRSTTQALLGRRQEYLREEVLLVDAIKNHQACQYVENNQCHRYHRQREYQCANNVKTMLGADYADSLTGRPAT